MANQIQRLVEDSIEEVEDLLERGLFDKAEVGALVAKRREFETRIHRFEVLLQDFLQYIEYELSVSKLIQKRKLRLKVTRSGIADFVAQRRINFIFDNALRKFKGNLDLWVAAIEYAQQNKNDARLSKLLGSAIKLFPTNVDFWTLAASHEFEDRKNVDAARGLMLQALRVNKHSAALWTEYFKLEFLFVSQVIERSQTLGAEVNAQALAKVLAVITNKALDARSDSQATIITDFLKIAESFADGSTKDVAGFVVQHLLECAEEAIADEMHAELLIELVKRRMKNAKDADAFLRSECDKYPHVALWDFYIERIASHGNRDAILEACREAYDGQLLSESSAMLWISAAKGNSAATTGATKRPKRKEKSEEIDLKELTSSLTTRFPKSASLWMERCAIDPPAFELAVTALNAEDSLPFWDALAKENPTALYRALQSLVKDAGNSSVVISIVNRLLLAAPSPSEEIKKLERMCLNVVPHECFEGLCKNLAIAVEARSSLFEMWVSRYPESELAWGMYVEYAKSVDGGKRYRAVLLRALHAVPSLKSAV